MNLLLGLLLATAPLSDASLTYRGPTSKKAAPDKYTFSRYSPGQTLRCAVDGANLRPGPGIDGDPIAQVPFGDEVTILEVAGEAVRVQDRVDRWYRVKTSAGEGFLFGNTLTPLFFEVDLDSDGKKEQVTVAFTAKLSVIVRVFEPWKAADARRIHGAVLRLSRGRVRGGEARAAVHTRPGRWGVVEVQSCQKQKCASGVVAFHAERALGSGRVTTKKGQSALAFRYGEVTLGGWQNLFRPGERSLVKQPCDGGCRADAVFVPGPRSTAATYEIEGYPRGPSVSGPCEVIGALEGSRFGGAELVSCPMGEGGKASPEYLADHYYARKGGDWSYLGGKLDEDQRAGLKQAGVRPRGGADLSIAGLEPPARLRAGKFGELTFVRHDEGDTDGPVVFVDPRVGLVIAVRDGYAARHPHKGRWLYDWTRPDAEVEGQRYTHTWRGASAFSDLRTRFVELSAASLKDSDPFKIPTAASNAVYPELKASLEAATQMGWKPSAPLAEGVVGLHNARAVLVAEDDFGRQVALTRADLVPPLMAEPIVYLWPTRATQVRVDVGGVGFAKSWPPARGAGWIVRAQPSGALEVDGGRYDRLFWEGFGEELPLLEGQLVVTAEDAAAQLAALARRAGLAGREVEELVEAWAPRAARLGRARLRVVDPDALETRVPLVVEPRPGAVIRLYIELSRAAPGERSAPIALPAPAARNGFVVAEWGGIER